MRFFLVDNQLKRDFTYTERVQTKITPFIKVKVDQYIEHEEREIKNYNMSEFLREAISLRLTIEKRNFQEQSIKSKDVFFQAAIASEFIPYVMKYLDLGISEEETYLKILLKLLRQDKAFQQFERKIRRETENMVINETIKWVKEQDIDRDLKKKILLKIQKRCQLSIH